MENNTNTVTEAIADLTGSQDNSNQVGLVDNYGEDYSMGFGELDSFRYTSAPSGFAPSAIQAHVEKIESVEDTALGWEVVQGMASGINPEIDQSMTVAEAIERGEIVLFSKNCVNYRADHGYPLGIVSNGYQVIQNSAVYDAVQRVFDGRADFDNAGSLYNGRKVWFQAKLKGGEFDINGDVTETYLLAVTSHDGSTAIEFMLVSVRVVCKNSLTLALRNGTNVVKIKHTGNAELGLGNVDKFYDEVFGKITAEKAIIQELAGKACDLDTAINWAYGFCEAKSVRSQNIARNIAVRFNRGIGNNGETRYDLLNGVTELFTHGTEESKQDSAQKFISSTFEGNAGKKSEALRRIQLDSDFAETVAKGKAINEEFAKSDKADSPSLVKVC